MGAIRRRAASPARVEYLYQSHTVGRASSCELVIAKRAISGHHATIRWAEGRWTLRDLGSRNGTFLNGQRLTGSPRPLRKGDTLTFAESDEVWELVDASEPRSQLVDLDSGSSPIELDPHDVLALPSTDQPLWTIYHQRDQWRLERDEECVVLENGQELSLGDRLFRVMLLDQVLAPTDTKTIEERQIEDLTLEIQVSLDEESAAVRVQLGAEVHELPPRTYFYLLAFLARRRIEQAGTPGSSEGWVDVPTTCRELSLVSPEALGLLVHRCRKALKSCAVDNPADIIDRSRKGRLRIGVDPDRLSVTRM